MFKDAFAGNHSKLVEWLDVEHGLLEELLDIEVISKRHLADIKVCYSTEHSYS